MLKRSAVPRGLREGSYEPVKSVSTWTMTCIRLQGLWLEGFALMWSLLYELRLLATRIAKLLIPGTAFRNEGMIQWRTNFPMYGVKALGEHHIVVAGGGGHSKTGVPNCLEVYGLEYADKCPRLVKLGRMDTGNQATMNMDVFAVNPVDGNFLLALGQDGNFLQSNYDVVSVSNGVLVENSDLKKWQRRGSFRETSTLSSTIDERSDFKRKLGMAFSEIKTLQTDFTPANRHGGPFQKVVRFAPCGSFFVSGGSDGHFRVWAYPSFKKQLDHNAHKDDVDDLDISRDSDLLVTVGRNGFTYIWRLNDCSKMAELHGARMTAAGVSQKYRTRFARFLFPEREGPFQLLVTCSIPVSRSTRKQACYLTLWRIEKRDGSCKSILSRSCGTEVISTMAVSKCSKYLGFGTLGGSLILVETESLRTLNTWKQVHSIFVTSVDFLPTHPPATSSFYPLVIHSPNVTLVSVSADNSCQLHVLDKSRCWSWPQLFLLFMMISNLLYLYGKFTGSVFSIKMF
ncbi:WD domain, G-beta repeat protein [Trichuris suis]|nr:WD domain, G-beta repeat protein [Trichuris suis]